MSNRFLVVETPVVVYLPIIEFDYTVSTVVVAVVVTDDYHQLAPGLQLRQKLAIENLFEKRL